MLHEHLKKLDEDGEPYEVRCFAPGYDRTFVVLAHTRTHLKVAPPQAPDRITFIKIDTMMAIEVITQP